MKITDPKFKTVCRAVARAGPPWLWEDLEQEAALALLQNRHARWGVMDALRGHYAPVVRLSRRAYAKGARVLVKDLFSPESVNAEGVVQTLADRLPAKDEKVDAKLLVRCLLGKLPPREAKIIRLRMEGWRLAEIGTFLGVTDCRISQLEKRAMGRLRAIARKESAR